MGKGLGWVLTIIGILLVAAGLVLMLAIVPGMKKLPADTDTTRDYQGTMTVMLNPSDFTFIKMAPIALQRHFKVTETDGDLALVEEQKTMTSNGSPLQQVVTNYAIDRTTMEATKDYPEAWASSQGLVPREGIVLSWPIGTEQKDYTGWSDDYMSTVPLKFVEEVTYERSGTKLYKFTSSSDPKPIVDETVTAMGLPTSLPKATVQQLLGSLDTSALPGDLLTQLFAKLPDPVPLQYLYSYEGTYWVDPASGIIVDTEKHETRSVTVSPDALPQALLALLPAEAQGALRLPVMDFKYTATDASVQAAKADADDAGSKLQLYGTTLPWIGIVAGAALLVVGIILLRRKTA
jgi:Porin PorA